MQRAITVANIPPYASCHRDHNNKNEKSKADYREITLFPIYSTTLLPLPEGSHSSDRRLAFSVVAHGTFTRAASVSFRAVQRRSLRTRGRLLLEGRACSCVCVCVWRKRARRGEIEAEAWACKKYIFLDTYWPNRQNKKRPRVVIIVREALQDNDDTKDMSVIHTRLFVAPVPPYTGTRMYIKNVYYNVYEEK